MAAPPPWPWPPESLLDALFEKAPIGLFVVDRELRYVRVNETTAAFNGLPAEAHIGRRMPELLPELAESVAPLVARILETGEPVAFVELCTDDPRVPGRKAWFLGSGYPVRVAGEIAGVGIVAAEITARKEMESALHESEVRFRQLAENIPAVFWLGEIDPPRAIYVSPAFEHIWGRSPESHYAEPLGFFEAVHPDDRGRLRRAQARMREETEFDVEFRILRPDGGVRWVHDRGFLVPGVPGRPRRAAGITTDITEHKYLEEQLRQAQKMESLGRLAGGMAHDFNNLMTAVLGHASFAATSLPEEHEARAELEEIRKAALRASELTRQLLAFARRQLVAPRVVDVNELMVSLDGLLRRLIGEDVELSSFLAGEPLCARIDPSQLEQVLVNLAVNARDAMPSGGRLVLVTAEASLPDERHPALPAGRYVRVSVSDTGHGIAPELFDHLFEPFFTTKEWGRGTGLGLATCYGIVRQCGGHIEVESAPGAGARFDVYLPRVEGPASAPAAAAEGRLPRGWETVLLVEDERSVRAVTSRILRAQGYRVIEAGDGVEALTLVARNPGPIHLLVADVVMPRMGGIELAERLRAVRPETRVLHVSGHVDRAAWEGPTPASGAVFLQKPFLPETLARKVREVLDGAPRP
jgi:two-component system cell cycle sensor histidine kinase/response regulator CckA